MTESWVYPCTEMHRALVDALSYPGDRVNVEAQSIENPFLELISNEFLLIAKTILDREVTFAVVSEQSQEIKKALSLMTGAKAVDYSLADYVFLYQKQNDEQLIDRILNLKRGNLVDPHHSATLIVGADLFDQTFDVVLTGPGIEYPKRVTLPMNNVFYDSRSQAVNDFPMGIDIIFIEANYTVLALPRTTKVEAI